MSYIGRRPYVETAGPQQIGGAAEAVMVRFFRAAVANPTNSATVKAQAAKWLAERGFDVASEG